MSDQDQSRGGAVVVATPASPTETFRRSEVYLFASGASCVTLMIGLLVLVIGSELSQAYAHAPKHMFDAPGGGNVLFLGGVDTAPQRWAYRSMLVVLALLCGLLTLLHARRSASLVGAMARSWAPAAIAAWAVVMIVLRALGLPHGFESLEVEPSHLVGFAVGGLFAAALCYFARTATSPRVNRACLALAFGLLAVLLGPAVWDRFDFSRFPWSSIEQLQADYEYTVAAADRLAAGEPLGEHMVPFYGLLAPVVMAGIQRHFGVWTFGDHIRFMQMMQLVFFALLLPSYAFYTRGRWLLGLLALAFVALDFHFRTYLLTMPNLMGWRFLGFPLAVLAVLAAQRMTPHRGAMFLGGGAGFALLYGLDTGTAITAALVLCVVLRFTGEGRQPWSRWLAGGAAFLAGTALVLLAFLVVHRVALGHWMQPEAPFALVRNLVLRAGGFGGHAPTFDPLAIVAFGHAAAVLVHAWIERSTKLSSRRAVRALAAAVVVVWFAYYVQRPNASCFTSLLMPYSFLLVDTLRVATLSLRGHRLGPWKIGLSLASLVLVVIPHVVTTARVQLPGYARGLERVRAADPPQGRLIQGVWLPDDARTRRILQQSEFLRSRPAGEPLFYFTADNFLVSKEAGVWPDLPLPMANAFLGSQTLPQYRALVGAVLDPSVQRIYFDSQYGLSEAEADINWQTRAFYKRLRLRLSRAFPQRRTVAGWEEWARH